MTDTPSRPVGLSVGATHRRRTPLILLGALLVLGAALGFALWSASLDDRRSVLVAAEEILAGEIIIDRTAFREVSVNVDAGVDAVPSDQLSSLVGQVATTGIPAGTLVGAGHFADQALLADGTAVVGATLAPGYYPTSGMLPGTRVLLIDAGDRATGSGVEVLGQAEVFGVQLAVEDTDFGEEALLFVSMLVDSHELAARVAQAEHDDDLRLARISELSTLTDEERDALLGGANGARGTNGATGGAEGSAGEGSGGAEGSTGEGSGGSEGSTGEGSEG